MKKFLTILLIAAMTFGLVACNGGGEKTANVEGSLEEIMEKMYEGIPSEELPMMLENQAVNAENVIWYLGTEDIDYKEALASESMIGSIAYSLVLVRLNEGADPELVKKDIKDSLNTNKWICVGIDKSELVVENIGDLVVVILSGSPTTRDALKANFENLVK